MWFKKLSRVIPVVVLVVVGVAGIGVRPALAVGPATQHHADVSLYTAANCWVIVAQLNGTQPPTTTCRLLRRPGETSRPDIGKVTCDNSGNSPQLQLYADANYSGTEPCLFGQGSDDLSVWSFANVMTSWNNPNVHNAPSGKIYKGTGETGASFSFGPGGHSPNVGSGWNDQAQSVCISVYPCP